MDDRIESRLNEAEQLLGDHAQDSLMLMEFRREFLKKCDRALKSFDEVLLQQPDNFRAVYGKARAMVKLRRYAAALPLLNKAAALHESNPHIYSVRSTVFYRMKRYQEALDDALLAHAYDPESEKVLLLICFVALKLKRYELVLDKSRVLTLKKPDHPTAKEYQIRALERMNRWGELLNCLQTADDDWKIILKSQVLRKLGRPDEAIAELDQIKPDYVSYINAQFIKATILTQTNQNELTSDSWQRFLDVVREKPDDYTFLIQAGDDNYKGLALENLGKMREALESYQEDARLRKEAATANRLRLLSSQAFWKAVDLDEKLTDLIATHDDDYLGLVDESAIDSDADKQTLRRLWALQYKLLSLLRYNEQTDPPHVAHYTSLSTFEKLIGYGGDTPSPLKLCSVTCANDPTEGMVFATVLNRDTAAGPAKPGNLVVAQTSYSTRIGHLTQYRLYGKADGHEGTGLCLVFDSRFFAGPGDGAPMVRRIPDQKEHRIDSLPDPPRAPKLPLYWVLYYDRVKKRLFYTPTSLGGYLDEHRQYRHLQAGRHEAEERLRQIGRVLDEIKKHYDSIRDRQVRNTAFDMLVYLRHLIKDAAFMDEQELRVIALYPPGHHELKPLGPHTLSADYRSILDPSAPVVKVIAGPKVEHFPRRAEAWNHHIHNNPPSVRIEFTQSDTPLS